MRLIRVDGCRMLLWQCGSVERCIKEFDDGSKQWCMRGEGGGWMSCRVEPLGEHLSHMRVRVWRSHGRETPRICFCGRDGIEVARMEWSDGSKEWLERRWTQIEWSDLWRVARVEEVDRPVTMVVEEGAR